MPTMQQYAGEPATADVGPSGAIWADCPVDHAGMDPSAGYHEFHDFLGELADATSNVTLPGWQVTEITNGQLNDGQEAGGVLEMQGDTGDNNGIQMQRNEAYYPAVQKPIWVETRVKFTDADDTDFVFGLGLNDDTLVAGVPDDFIGFVVTDGSANITFQVRDGATGDAVDTGEDLADLTYVKLGFKIETVSGALRVTPYVDGVELTAKAVTANITDDNALALSIGMHRCGTTATNIVYVDWIRAAQARMAM